MCTAFAPWSCALKHGRIRPRLGCAKRSNLSICVGLSSVVYGDEHGIDCGITLHFEIARALQTSSESLMRRTGILVFLAIASMASWSCGKSMGVEAGSQSAIQDQSEIYRAFLTQWVGTGQQPINVSRMAEGLSRADMKNLTECAASGTQWVTPAPPSDITSQLSRLSHVRPIAPKTWRPQDPQNLIAHGRPVVSAVDRGISYGLMTLSVVVFDTTRHTAALKYSFVCGGLCGNGGTVIFIKTRDGWARSKRGCGTWMS